MRVPAPRPAQSLAEVLALSSQTGLDNPVKKLNQNLVRRFYKGLTGVDTGANPTGANIAATISGTGIIPVMPVADPSNSTPLLVRPLGWYRGQVIDSVNPTGNTATQTIKGPVYASAKAGDAIVAGTGLLLYTVTTGKTLYVTDITVHANNTDTGHVFYDNTVVGGTVKFSAGTNANNGYHCHFTVPLVFANGIFEDSQSNATYHWTIAGWEE